MSCLAAKPIVNGIENDLRDAARVVRLDIGSEMGKSVAGRYGVSSVPTLLVVDGGGDVVHRESGLPSRKKVVSAVTAA